jgi:hypothetical protein
MTLRDNYREIMKHLRAAYDATRDFTEPCEDFTAVVQLKEEFFVLRDQIRQFARCQHGMDRRDL